MSIASESESIFSFENQHLNFRTGMIDEESSSYSGSKVQENRRSYVIRVDPIKNKRVKVVFFETNLTPNRYIKNAVTGILQTPFRVGTADEDLFFSVVLSTGECGQTPPCLFYDSPEQYERHFYTQLSDSVKKSWNEKYNAAIQLREKKK